MRHPLAIGLAALALLACGGDDDDVARLDPDLPAPTGEVDTGDVDDVVLEGLTGGEIALADYAGRPVVVNFFASFCAPCVQEMPAIEALKQEVGDGAVFVGVATNDDVDDALDLVDRTGVTWELARDPRGDFMNAVGGVVLPTTVVVDADGGVVWVRSGELDDGELRELRDQLAA
jgi:thiol-disulfide isomerase/thioredoxin